MNVICEQAVIDRMKREIKDTIINVKLQMWPVYGQPKERQGICEVVL